MKDKCYSIILQNRTFLFIEFLIIVLVALNLPLAFGFIISALFYFWIIGCCYLLSRKASAKFKLSRTVYVLLIVFIFSFGPLYHYTILTGIRVIEAILSFAYFFVALFLYLYFTYLLIYTECVKGIKGYSFNKLVTFLQIAFFPIGVWYLQPRLSVILAKDDGY